MSFLFVGRTRQVARVLSAVVVLICIIGMSSVAAQAAGIVRVNDQIAQAKAKVFGEYPKAETAWPDVVRPEFPVEEQAPANEKTQAAVEKNDEQVKAEASTEAQVEEKVEAAAEEVKEAPAAPAPKAEAPKAEAPEKKAPEVQPTPEATVEAAAVVAPAPVETQAPAAIESTGDTWVDEILRLVNENRASEGLAALTINSKAQEAAAIRVVELPNSPSPHLRPDGAQFYTVFAEVGLKPKTGGENYAIGTANAYSPEQIVAAWMNSAGHRKNIMNATYKQIGIGHAVIGDKEYFEQLFIG